MADNQQDQNIPKPDKALQRLQRLVGAWKLTGRPLGAHRDTITGKTTFKWLHNIEGSEHTGFILQQDMDMDYDGMPIKSHELIYYNPETKAFSSQVYSNMAPDPWPYQWNIEGNTITISITKNPMDATFTGTFSPDGNSWSGGWRPNPGADKDINAPYDITATRIK